MGRLAVCAAVSMLGVALLPGDAPAGGLLEHFRSVPRDIEPALQGLSVRVLGGDDELQLRNQSGRTVVVEGYDRDPYLRFKPDGTVERNQRSPATFLNADRQGSQKVPPEAIPGAKPQWRKVASGGNFRWFDHRIHITNPQGPPPQAKGKDKPTKILSWTVPLTVEGNRAAIHGALFWDPDTSSGGFPLAAVIAGVAAIGAIIAIVSVFLHRRRPPRPMPPAETEGRSAW